MRDVRAVGGKLKAVLLPLDRNVSLFFMQMKMCLLMIEYNNIFYTFTFDRARLDMSM